LFCTLTEGVRSPKAREWRLIDDSAKPQQFASRVRQRALELAALSDRPSDATGFVLNPLERRIDAAGYHYSYVDVNIDRATRTAIVTVSAPAQHEPEDLAGILARGIDWWPLAMARELDDAILLLRTNDLEIGTWLLKTRGRAQEVLSVDRALVMH